MTSSFNKEKLGVIYLWTFLLLVKIVGDNLFTLFYVNDQVVMAEGAEDLYGQK